MAPPDFVPPPTTGLNVGTVCYAADMGIGYLPLWLHRLGLVSDVAVVRHPSRPCRADGWYGPGRYVRFDRHSLTGPDAAAWLRRLDVLLQVETPFDWRLFGHARRLGVRSACLVMHECTPARLPPDRRPDLWLAPSGLDAEVFPGSVRVPTPLPPDLAPWSPRTRAGRFLHSAGNLGLRGRNGTDLVLAAWRLLGSAAPPLVVRCQDASGLARAVAAAGLSPADLPSLNVTVDPAPRTHADLFDDADVLVSPERHNGLSLPLQEAHAAGLAVLTTDRFPARSWLPRRADPADPSSPPLLVAPSRRTVEVVAGGCLPTPRDEVHPSDLAAAVRGLAGADVSAASAAGRAYRDAADWGKIGPRWSDVLLGLFASTRPGPAAHPTPYRRPAGAP